MVSDQFSKHYGDRILGSLSGFDRLLLRGSLRLLCKPSGLQYWLSRQRVLRKQFMEWAEKLSQRLRDYGVGLAKQAGRPYRYLYSAKESKEKIAEQIVEQEGIRQGLVCVLAIVEPCLSYRLAWQDQRGGKLRLVRAQRKCLFLYFYWVHEEFGLMHVRLQTWFPFEMQVCLNGREWLAREMDREGLGYQRRDNCFVWLQDVERTQQLADGQVRIHWERKLKGLARQANPLLQDVLQGLSYFWSVRQGEYATDVMFRNREDLAAVYPLLARYAIEHFHSADVLRFLGAAQPNNMKGRRVESHFKRRPEGVRVKHQVHENSLKMYDKQGMVLRIEVTINNPQRFRVYRRDGKGRYRWMRMRRGTVDMRRRVEISRAANRRYLEALASIPEGRPAASILDGVSRPVQQGSQQFRALRPVAPEEARAWEVLLHGEHLLQGFRNAELRKRLFPNASTDPSVIRALSGKVSRRIRLWRAHHLIQRQPGTHRYQLTQRGIAVGTTALQLRSCDLQRLAIAT